MAQLHTRLSSSMIILGVPPHSAQLSCLIVATRCGYLMLRPYVAPTSFFRYRETEQQMSRKFQALFNNRITIMEGGIESGFNHVEETCYPKRLLHVKVDATGLHPSPHLPPQRRAHRLNRRLTGRDEHGGQIGPY